jgi:hypothetical protein
MNDYDKGGRFAIKRLDPRGFLLWLLVGLEELVFNRWLDTQAAPFPGEPDRRCDTVAEMVSPGHAQPPWAVVVEPQAQWQAYFGVRLLQYELTLFDELRHGPHGQDRYPMAGAVVNLSGRDLQGEVAWTPPGQTGGVGLVGKVWVRNLHREDAAGTLADIASGKTARCVLPWVVLMQGGERDAIIGEWKRLAQLEQDATLRANYAGLALVFADKAGRQDAWRKGLEGWDMQHSTFADEWRQEGLEKGREEGLVAMRSTVERIVITRFPEGISEEVLAAIREQSDLDTLKRWADLGLTSPSLEQFRQAMQKANGSSPA